MQSHKASTGFGMSIIHSKDGPRVSSSRERMFNFIMRTRMRFRKLGEVKEERVGFLGKVKRIDIIEEK